MIDKYYFRRFALWLAICFGLLLVGWVCALLIEAFGKIMLLPIGSVSIAAIVAIVPGPRSMGLSE
jgi:hypothetical protein